MDSKDFKGIANLILVILFIAAAVLGPLVDKWRKKKEAEKRRLEGKPEGELEPPPGPAYDEGRPRLPYENVLEEVFGPYIERRRRAAQEASQAPAAAPVVEEDEPDVQSDDEIRRMRETRRPVDETVEEPEPEDPIQRLAESGPAEAVHRRKARSLDELLFRNPRLSPGAKLLLASEILGKPPAARRGSRGFSDSA